VLLPLAVFRNTCNTGDETVKTNEVLRSTADIFYCCSNLKVTGKEYGRRREGDKGTKRIKESKKGASDKDTKEFIPG
jgi:hypothetical protein